MAYELSLSYAKQCLGKKTTLSTYMTAAMPVGSGEFDILRIHSKSQMVDLQTANLLISPKKKMILSEPLASKRSPEA